MPVRRQGRRAGRHRHRGRLPAPQRDRHAAAPAEMARVHCRAGPARRGIRACVRPESRRDHDARSLRRQRGRSLETVVELMERRRIKRLPVMRGGRMVGIVSRANLHARAGKPRPRCAGAGRPGLGDPRSNSGRARQRSTGRPTSTSWSKTALSELWGSDHGRPRASGPASSRPRTSPASSRCTIIWSGSSRCRHGVSLARGRREESVRRRTDRPSNQEQVFGKLKRDANARRTDIGCGPDCGNQRRSAACLPSSSTM